MKKLILPLFGNIFEHFDKALFALLMPFIAVQFFGPISIYQSLAIAFMPVEAIFRPIGAYFLSKKGDTHGRKKVFLTSIQYTGIIALGFAFLPTYSHIGVLSPVLLLFLRALLAFVSSVETTGALLLIYENHKNKEKMSSLYQISGMVGVFLATCSVLVLVGLNQLEFYWRALYFIGGIACFGVLFFQNEIQESLVVPRHYPLESKTPIKPFFALCFAHGFSYGNYFILMTVMHIFLQNIVQVGALVSMQMQLGLIALDILLLWLIFPIIKQRDPTSVFLFCLLVTLLFVFPLFGMLHHPSVWNIFFARVCFLTVGVTFAINMAQWSTALFPPTQRFRAFSLSKAIGGQWIGTPSVSICMLFYEKFQTPYVFAIYLSIITLIAMISAGFVRALVRSNLDQMQKS